MRELITKEGFSFAFDQSACEKCGSKCCAGEAGDVWVSSEEAREIALFLGVDFAAAQAIYFRTEREGMRIKERSGARGFECVFLGNLGCEIYSVRPKQCASFPFWIGAEKAKYILAQECGGIVI
ncbi:zinc/iron-chelating domain-containing protein [Campylobacterota bacterium]|nr:zinc/iron-chelating domain-containing protein [Campylobacterota bacterium]